MEQLMEPINENLKKLAAFYNCRELYALHFCRFELKPGESLNYPTAKNALIFPVEGTAIFQLDYLKYSMKMGKFLHACPGKQLTVTNQSDASFRYVVVYYDGKIQPVFEVKVNHYDVLLNKLEKILSYNGSTLLTDAYRQEVMIEQFFEQLFQDIQPAGISTDGDLLEVALEYIQNHYCEKITLSSLAEQVGTSDTHLSYLFKKNLKICPIDYLIDYRIKQAIRLLRQPTCLAISEAARQVGYSDADYFSRIFKRRMGFAPSKIRGR